MVQRFESFKPRSRNGGPLRFSDRYDTGRYVCKDWLIQVGISRESSLFADRMRKARVFAPLAQSVEHMTFNHGVMGSIPIWRS